jgi:hypothetical protein
MDGTGRVSLGSRVYLGAIVPFKPKSIPEVTVCGLGWGERLPSPEDDPSLEEVGDDRQGPGSGPVWRKKQVVLRDLMKDVMEVPELLVELVIQEGVEEVPRASI